MIRRRPSRRAVAVALKYYEGLRVDGEPPGNGRGAASGCQPEVRQEVPGETKHSTRAVALDEFGRCKIVYTAAIKALIAGERIPAEQVDAALDALNRAREVLRRIDEGAPC